jgi:hypothetical protein
MANTILAFDEQDLTLGPFFLACQDDLDVFLNENGITIKRINSSALNDVAIIAHTENLAPFIFGAYSHGAHDCLLKSATDPYISIALNGKSFKKSFFYTFSCSAGKELGVQLIANECLCFIGYKEDVAIWTTYPKPFVECANYGLIQFYNGSNTDAIISEMKTKYNNHIDDLYKTDYMIAAILRENRDALVKHGNTITIADLN